MVGSALVRSLGANSETQLVTRSRSDLDLTRQSDVESFFADQKIDMVAASCHLMDLSAERYWSTASDRCSHVNVGCGTDVSIAELAQISLEQGARQTCDWMVGHWKEISEAT